MAVKAVRRRRDVGVVVELEDRGVGKTQCDEGNLGVGEEVPEEWRWWPTTRGPEEEDDVAAVELEIRRHHCKIEAETSREGRGEVRAALGSRRRLGAHRTEMEFLDDALSPDGHGGVCPVDSRHWLDEGRGQS